MHELTLSKKELIALIATWQALDAERLALSTNQMVVIEIFTGRVKQTAPQDKKLKEQEKNLEKQQKNLTKNLKKTLEKLSKHMCFYLDSYDEFKWQLPRASNELHTIRWSLLQRQHIVEKAVSYLAPYNAMDPASLTANHNPELPAEGSANALSPPQTASTTPKEDSQ